MNYDEYTQEAKRIVSTVSPYLIRDIDIVHDVAQNLVMIDNDFRYDCLSSRYNPVDEGSCKSGYRFQMSKFLILTRLRQKKKNESLDILNEPQTLPNNRVFENAKDILSKKYYNIIEKYYLYNYTLKEISEDCNKSSEWVRINLKIAIDILKEEYV